MYNFLLRRIFFTMRGKNLLSVSVIYFGPFKNMFYVLCLARRYINDVAFPFLILTTLKQQNTSYGIYSHRIQTLAMRTSKPMAFCLDAWIGCASSICFVTEVIWIDCVTSCPAMYPRKFSLNNNSLQNWRFLDSLLLIHKFYLIKFTNAQV